jgi:hypothetical protein
MTALCDLRKILRGAQARRDGGPLKVSTALKASTACWGVGRKKKRRPPNLTHQIIKIHNMQKIEVGDKFTLPSRFALVGVGPLQKARAFLRPFLIR